MNFVEYRPSRRGKAFAASLTGGAVQHFAPSLRVERPRPVPVVLPPLTHAQYRWIASLKARWLPETAPRNLLARENARLRRRARNARASKSRRRNRG